MEFICPYCSYCPYLDFQSITTLLYKLDYYKRNYEQALIFIEEEKERLEGENEKLKQENEKLKEKIEALSRNSTESNKPPSSDGLKKIRGTKRESSGRKPGGQEGHEGKTRRIVPPDEISKIIEHKPKECKKCGKLFTGEEKSEPVERHQVWEIPEPIKPIIEENIFFKTLCGCGYETREIAPDWMYSGTGENLQALIAFLTGEIGLSRRNVKTILEEVFNISTALGTIQNRLEDTSEILKPVYDELEEELVKQKVVNIDETSYPHNKALEWLWGFATKMFAFFTIQASRGSKVLKRILTELYEGIIICDRFSAYIKYQKDRLIGLIQFCWAHIIREVKALKYELAYGSNKPFSKRCRQKIGSIFRLWYCFKAEKITRKELIEKSEPLIKKIYIFLEENLQSRSKKVIKFCSQILKRWDSLWTFIYHEGVEPTNNLAERILRLGVKLRKISYCTRSKAGQNLLERLLTVTQTCRIQKKSSLKFFRAVIHAKRNNLSIPSLLLNVQEKEILLAA